MNRLSLFTTRRAGRQRFFRPWLEILEGRCLPAVPGVPLARTQGETAEAASNVAILSNLPGVPPSATSFSFVSAPTGPAFSIHTEQIDHSLAVSHPLLVFGGGRKQPELSFPPSGGSGPSKGDPVEVLPLGREISLPEPDAGRIEERAEGEDAIAAGACQVDDRQCRTALGAEGIGDDVAEVGL